MSRKPSKKDQAIIDAGRKHLRAWLKDAEKHGTIYYAIESVSRSGMNRKIVLSTIVKGRDGKPELMRLWPRLPDDAASSVGDYSSALDIVARDWGFSFKARAFDVGGCGMDMVFALVSRLARMADDKGTGANDYANRVRREAF